MNLTINERNEANVRLEFLRSWDDIEQFYSEFRTDSPIPTLYLNLVREMRENGYHEHLRAGQGMINLILSRSLRHGLHQGQPYLFLTACRLESKAFDQEPGPKIGLSVYWYKRAKKKTHTIDQGSKKKKKKKKQDQVKDSQAAIDDDDYQPYISGSELVLTQEFRLTPELKAILDEFATTTALD